MKAGIVYTGTGPILILTSCDSLEHPDLAARLGEKGINKYVAFEVALELVRKNYGQHFAVVLGDSKQSDFLRVVDVEGQRIFNDFALEDMGQPIYHEEPVSRRKAA